jgi:hypothetical protein
MPLTIKKIIALTVVLVGAVTSLIILKISPEKEVGISVSTTGSGPNFNFQADSSEIFSPSVNKDNELSENRNLTDSLARLYAQTIINENPDGITSSEYGSEINVFSTETATTILQEQLGQGLTFKPFESSDLKISDNNSSINQLSYLENVGKISQKNFGNLKYNFAEMLDEWALKENNAPMEGYVSRIPNQIEDLKILTVPSELIDFHLQNLNLWKKKLVIFTAIINMKNDPLKTFLAAQELPNIVQESLDLQDIVEKKYTTLKG